MKNKDNPVPLLTQLRTSMLIKPKYQQSFCGCGEGWSDERCEKLTELMNDGNHHCIFKCENGVGTNKEQPKECDCANQSKIGCHNDCNY